MGLRREGRLGGRKPDKMQKPTDNPKGNGNEQGDGLQGILLSL